jgi:hypothetical protein
LDKSSLPFDADEYSKFKYGCKRSARNFGTQTAEAFIKALEDGLWKEEMEVLKRPIIVIPSPYEFVPTATFAMKDYFNRRLNDWLVDHNFPPVQELKIYRKSSYIEDYGLMDESDRQKAITGDHFYIDHTFCFGKLCIFLDDIRITGAHEERVQHMINVCNGRKAIFPFQNYVFTYFAVLENREIDPTIESFLNLHYVKSLKHIDKLIKNDEFLLNTRVVKYILSYDHNDCKEFLDYQRDIFLHTLYHQAIGNSYHLADKFKQNIEYLKTLIAHG